MLSPVLGEMSRLEVLVFLELLGIEGEPGILSFPNSYVNSFFKAYLNHIILTQISRHQCVLGCGNAVRRQKSIALKTNRKY